MADVKFRSVRHALATGGGDTDITLSGFGTPKAGIFICSDGVTDDAGATGLRWSVGFTDGVRQVSMGTSAANAVTTTASKRRQQDDAVVIIQNTSADTALVTYDLDTVITDGFRLSASGTTAAARLLNTVLIGGADVAESRCGMVQLNGTTPVDVTDMSGEPDLVFLITIGLADVPGGTDNGLFSFGIAHNGASLVQKSIGICSRNGQSTSINNLSLDAANIGRLVFNDGSVNFPITISDFDSQGFSLVAGSATTSRVGYLALRFTNSPDIALFNTTIPASGNYAETSPGFEPGFGLIWNGNAATGYDGIRNGFNYGFGIATFDDTRLFTTSVSDEDNQSTTDTESLSSDQFRGLSFAGSERYAGTFDGFDANGWDFTLTTNPAADVLGFGLAIEPGEAGGVTPIPPPLHGISKQHAVINAHRLGGVLQ